MISLASRLTVLASAISSQLRAIPALIASHFLYRATTWTIRQALAFLLVAVGTFIFSWSRKKGDTPSKSPTHSGSASFTLDDQNSVFECPDVDDHFEIVPEESITEFRPERSLPR
jgi:hypothetical protein